MERKIYSLFISVKRKSFALAFILFWSLANSQTTYTFVYTGSTQTISLPAGNYSIQCWGADGGNANSGANPMLGGKGGYATGIFTNPTTGTFNVYVGGHGGNASSAQQVGGGGGGMSDIAPASNTTLIIIAAGAGGGGTSGNTSGEASTGGDGGGLTGGTAVDGTGVSSGTAASGGSQTTGGIAQAGSYGAGFQGGYGYGGGASNGGSSPASPSGTMHAGGGIGGNGGNGGWNGGGAGSISTGINDHAGGGGAGYYGGGGGRGDGGAGGGGSSYIGGVTSGTTVIFGQTGFVANPDVTGNGHILITELCSISLLASGPNSVNPIICSGQSLTLTTNAISNYSWSTGATTSSLVVSPTSNTVIGLTATSPSNCTASRNISITVSSGVPVLSISNPSNNICLGKTVSLTASGALTYTWANPGIVNGQTFTPTSTMVYTVTGQNGCGVSTATTTITVAPLAISAMASSTLVCEGDATTLTAISSATNYTWMPGSLPNFSTVVAPMANTIYTVSASDGTCAGTQTVAVNTKVVPTVNITSTGSSICNGDQLVITASGANSYTWQPGNQTGNTVTVSPQTSTVYVVTGENSVGCFGTNQQIVIVLQTPTINITASKLLVCSGQSVSLNPTGGNSYTWTNGPTTGPYVVTPAVTSVYTVTGGHTVNVCTAAKTITISALSPTLTLPTNTQVCIGSSVTVYASGADAYQWNSISTGSVGIYSTFPQTTTTVTLVATTKSLTTSCPTTHTFEIKANPLPSLTVTPKRAVVCRNETNTLTVSGAQNYTWTSTVSGASMVITPAANVTYSVAGEDANGCVAIFNYQAKVNACVGINGSAKTGDLLQVFPNPNQGKFVIKSQTPFELVLVNELGQELTKCQLDVSNDYTHEFTDLKPGIYFIHDVRRSGSIVEKVIVN